MMDNFDKQMEIRWEEMVSKGVLQEAGDDGEFLLDKNRLKEVDLDLYEQYVLSIDEAIFNLFKHGLVDVQFFEDDIVVELTESGQQWSKAAGLTYPDF